MQQQFNAALAAALAPGQVRNMTVLCQFDWGRDGTFSNQFSDLSDNVTDWVLDKQGTGSYPTTLEVVEGYAGATLTITLAGNAKDTRSTPVWRLFSPYAGFMLGRVGYAGAPVQLSLVIATSAGPVTLRQFTGVVQMAVPSRGNSNVTVTCLDGAGICQVPATLPPWASSATIQNLLGGSNPLAPDVYDTCQIMLSWVIERLLRTAGFYQGPQWPSNTMLAWTLTGAALPDVGHFAIEDTLINGTFQFGYGEFLIPNKTPASLNGASVWVPNNGFVNVLGAVIPYQYGPAFIGVGNLPAWPGGPRYVTEVTGCAHSATTYPGGAINSYGSNNSNLMTMGAWVYRDASQSNSVFSTIQIHLEEARYDYHYNSGNQYPAQVQLNINHNSGLMSLQVKNNGWGSTWSWSTSTAIPNNAWTYVYFTLAFTSTAILGYCSTSGGTSLMTPGTNGGVAAAIGSLPYTLPPNSSLLGQVNAAGPMNYASISYQYNTPIANLVTPPSAPPVAYTGRMDLSITRLNWLPDEYQQPVWDLLKAIAEAELGIIYFDEMDNPVFYNRGSVQALSQLAPQFTITLDDAQDITPTTTLDSVVNNLSMTWTSKQGQEYSAVYKEAGATDFQIASGAAESNNITLSDVQSIRNEFVSWRTQAQGYGYTSGTPQYNYDIGGQGPGVGYTYKDWMNFYGPDFWTDGFTAHVPSGALNGAQPADDTGINCEVWLGWVTGEQEIRHVRFITSSGNASTCYFSVDDTTPFLNVQGTAIVDNNGGTITLTDSTSQANYGPRALPMPASDWNQDPVTLNVVVASLLQDLKQPTPYMAAIPCLGDPRIQLMDVGQVVDPAGMGSMSGLVNGIHREFSITAGLTDSLTFRLVSTGYAWVLDDPNLSILDATTWLA